jgi:multisubunit Na+/H+ antiporter MnhC subunit
MNARRILEWGGLAAGITLIAFGIGALYMGIDGRNTVRDSIAQEQIYFGDATDPAVAEHAEQWAGEQVTTGDQARAFALVMREHTLSSTDGLTYAQMGRFQSAANPQDPKGTSDEAAAAKDEAGAPIANDARQIWVTETGLTTALNMSYMAEQLSVFGIVVGVALLLTGIGLMILALAVLGGRFRDEASRAARPTTAAVTGH